MPETPQLEDEILAALGRALRERRHDVAGHLLRALEALGADAARVRAWRILRWRRRGKVADAVIPAGPDTGT